MLARGRRAAAIVSCIAIHGGAGLRQCSSTTATGNDQGKSSASASAAASPEGEQIPAERPLQRGKGPDEEKKWWPTDNSYTSKMRRSVFDSSKKALDGMLVPELKAVPTVDDQPVTHIEDSYFSGPEVQMIGEQFEQESRMLPPAQFDPELDEIDEKDFMDGRLVAEVIEAAEHDKKRMEELGNPLSAADQIDMFMKPQREGQEQLVQRQEFNGFAHWGLLYAATIALDQQNDPKKAHQMVNRYLRDIDLFEQWLKHPKILKHIKLKFNLSMDGRFDKLMAMSLALYVRSKIQLTEGDTSGALKSLIGAGGMIQEQSDLKLERHRKVLGSILAVRGCTYLALESAQRAEDDLTQALKFLPKNGRATVFQVRAEAREQLGKLEEAREDEETAADLWENAQVIHPGMDHQPVKWMV